jgi:hypothetical protein
MKSNLMRSLLATTALVLGGSGALAAEVNFTPVPFAATDADKRAVLASEGFQMNGQTYADLEEGALAEVKEDHDFPNRLPIFDGDAETGLANGVGWRLQAFIEDRDGALRPQSFEETVFCVGCHGGIGATDDSTFALSRKLDQPAGGWFHWSRRGLAGVADPERGDGSGEYAGYLRQNGAGDEFRANDEAIAAFFEPDGTLDDDALAKLREDVASLLYPSRRRALDLDKAYRTIVIDQDFVRGRDPLLAPATNVHRAVEQNQPTGIDDPVPRS